MRLGIFARLVLALSTLLCLALAAMGYLLVQEAQQRFEQSQLSQAKALVHSLADGSLDALVSKDYELLERWVAAAVPTDLYAYAYLAGADGRILSHSDPVQVGRQGTPAAGPLDSAVVRQEQYQGRPVVEVIYPAHIGDKLLAHAYVAYFVDSGPFYLGAIAGRIGMILLASMGLLALATIVLLRHLLQPLRQLTQVIARASFTAPAATDARLLRRRDEIGALARAFAELHERLAAAYQELLLEEQRLKVAVEQRTQELSAANRELEAFSYSVSHDLRAPLRAIHGFSAALIEDCGAALGGPCHAYLDRIQSASEKMGHLIDDMLQLSRISRVEMQQAPVDLADLARRIVDALRQRDARRNVEFVLPDALTVIGDARLLTIALDNLFGNAWKFSRDRSAARIEFGRTKKNNEEIYFIRDNGAGFNMAYVDKLFKAFQRLHTEQQFEGTGVGLSIVQRIIHRHGGRIWAEAEEGVGATFYFTLGGDRHDAARTVQ